MGRERAFPDAGLCLFHFPLRVDLNREKLDQLRFMAYRVLKMGVCQINLTDFPFCVCLKNLRAERCGVRIRRRFDDIGTVFLNGIAAPL